MTAPLFDSDSRVAAPHWFVGADFAALVQGMREGMMRMSALMLQEFEGDAALASRSVGPLFDLARGAEAAGFEEGYLVRRLPEVLSYCALSRGGPAIDQAAFGLIVELVGLGASPDATGRGAGDMTPLTMACSVGGDAGLAAARLLLSLGADPSSRVGRVGGLDAEAFAKMNNNHAIVAALREEESRRAAAREAAIIESGLSAVGGERPAQARGPRL